ncbi:MAG TPA: branched-chain-amino-acid transaminase [Chitinispirillaceae bacterium]|nr:branched-chain-amino-acid transaminase [Chitinispirillaceae bacterium]
MMIYIDGNFYEKENAVVPVFDHGLLYGDGVFEGIRIYNGHVFKLHEHLRRLFDSCKAIALDPQMSIEQLQTAVLDAVEKNQKSDGYIRLIITRGDGPLGIDPTMCKKARVIIIVGDISLYPQEYYSKGIRICTSTYRRIPSDCFDVRIKSLNYLNNVLAKIEARQNGCLESVMLNVDGHVAECTGDNIFIVRNGILITPAVTEGALSGITRNAIIDIATKANLNTIETVLTRFDLYTADECFLTGTAAEIIPVISIDGRTIGKGIPGSTTGNLIELFKTNISQSI